MYKIFPILFFLLCSCKQKPTRHQVVNGSFFKSDSVTFHKATFISEIWPEFLGKFKPGDTTTRIESDSDIYRYDLSDPPEVKNIVRKATGGLKMYVDYHKYIKPTYPRNDKNFYFPVYFVNKSDKYKFVTIKDDYVLALQEALNKNGKWYPIERRGNEECLNGGWALKVLPKEFVVFLMKKYEGDFKTKLRIRFQNGRRIYFSETFEGYINERQFYFENPTWTKAFKEDPEFVSSFHFYGAIPLEATGK